MAIKHISLDLWLTLIRSDPRFREQRIRFLADEFNPKKLSTDEISILIKDVDICCNDTNQVTGRNLTANEMYCMVLHRMGNTLTSFSDDDITGIKNTINSFLDVYPPVYYDAGIVPVLDKLAADGYSLSLSSNTAFLEGQVLSRVLDYLQLLPRFRFIVYSDELKYSKPSPYFFNEVYRHAGLLHQHKLERNEIVHVGDNPLADIKGAAACGMKTFLVHSNKQRLEDFYNHLPSL
jgi:putative hydrolase of the HAD superfamily